MADPVVAPTSAAQAVAAVLAEHNMKAPEPGPSGYAVEAAPEVIETETPAPAAVPVKEGEVKPDGEESIIVKEGETVPAKEKVAAAPETEPEEFHATHEELQEIDKNPGLKKVYRSIQRRFTEKTTEIANFRKQGEAAIAAVETMRTNPKESLKALAEMAGATIKFNDEASPATPASPAAAVVPAPSTLEKTTKFLTDKLGAEAAEVLGPTLVELVEMLTEEKISPLKKTNQINEEQAATLARKRAVSDFGANIVKEGGEWDEAIEKEVADLIRSGKILPGENATLPEFLTFAHNHVTAGRSRKTTVSTEVDRLRRVAAAAEPVRPARTAPPAAAPSITAEMDPKLAVSLAVKLAREQMAAR